MNPILILKRVCGGYAAGVVLFVFFSLGSAAAEGENWGAIAYAFDTGADGYSFGYSSVDMAKQRALKECRRRGSDCMVVVWFRNECAALAIGFHNAEAPAGKLPDGQGLGMDKKLEIAESEALERCRKTTKNCYIIRSVCAGQ